MQTYNIYVYKIWWDKTDDIYVGSTKQRLAVRMAGHRSLCKKNNSMVLYKKMREYGYKFKYVLLEAKDVKNCDEKRKLEQEYIDKLKPSLNSARAYYDPNMWTDGKEIEKRFIKIKLKKEKVEEILTKLEEKQKNNE